MNFLKRRNFMTGATGLAAGFFASQQGTSAGQLQRLNMQRTSMLFDDPSKGGVFIRLIATDNHAVTLFRHGDMNSKQFGVAAYTFEGFQLWQHQLPAAFTYAAVGTASAGKTILLPAGNLRLPTGRMLPACLLA
ncbi:MAG TPA: hypothetical protein VFA65_07945 [Bryobacteraceae bacterium]|nr:hypothetical protein [Bryobacteraceae bacterium]